MGKFNLNDNYTRQPSNYRVRFTAGGIRFGGKNHRSYTFTTTSSGSEEEKIHYGKGGLYLLINWDIVDDFYRILTSDGNLSIFNGDVRTLGEITIINIFLERKNVTPYTVRFSPAADKNGKLIFNTRDHRFSSDLGYNKESNVDVYLRLDNQIDLKEFILKNLNEIRTYKYDDKVHASFSEDNKHTNYIIHLKQLFNDKYYYIKYNITIPQNMVFKFYDSFLQFEKKFKDWEETAAQEMKNILATYGNSFEKEIPFNSVNECQYQLSYKEYKTEDITTTKASFEPLFVIQDSCVKLRLVDARNGDYEMTKPGIDSNFCFEIDSMVLEDIHSELQKIFEIETEKQKEKERIEQEKRRIEEEKRKERMRIEQEKRRIDGLFK